MDLLADCQAEWRSHLIPRYRPLRASEDRGPENGLQTVWYNTTQPMLSYSTRFRRLLSRCVVARRGRRLGVFLLGSLWKDLAKEVGQKSVQAPPGLFPQTIVSHHLVRWKQETSVHHYQENVLQTFRNGFLLYTQSEHYIVHRGIASGGSVNGLMRRRHTYQIVSLSAVHQPVHDIKDPEPEVKHTLPL